MGEIVLNQSIDQLDLGEPKVGDFGVFKDMAANKTKRYLLPIIETTQNFEWVTDNDPGYATDEVVTYGGSWWQSLIDDNLNIAPGTDDAAWVELTRGTAGTWWTAGVYSEDKPWVLSDHNGFPEILYLASATRPYNSANITTEEAAGDWVSITQLLKNKTIDSSGAISVLNFLNAAKKAFILDTSIDAAHEIQFSNSADAKEFEIKFDVDVVAPITFPASVEMPDALFDDGTKVWTPLDTGTYYGRAVLFGATWVLELKRVNK